jgi:hypothetical protein
MKSNMESLNSRVQDFLELSMCLDKLVLGGVINMATRDELHERLDSMYSWKSDAASKS